MLLERFDIKLDLIIYIKGIFISFKSDICYDMYLYWNNLILLKFILGLLYILKGIVKEYFLMGFLKVR